MSTYYDNASYNTRHMLEDLGGAPKSLDETLKDLWQQVLEAPKEEVKARFGSKAANLRQWHDRSFWAFFIPVLPFVMAGAVVGVLALFFLMSKGTGVGVSSQAMLDLIKMFAFGGGVVGTITSLPFQLAALPFTLLGFFGMRKACEYAFVKDGKAKAGQQFDCLPSEAKASSQDKESDLAVQQGMRPSSPWVLNHMQQQQPVVGWPETQPVLPYGLEEGEALKWQKNNPEPSAPVCEPVLTSSIGYMV